MVADMVRAVALAQEAVRAKEPKPEASHAQWLASFFCREKSQAKKSPRGERGLKGCSLGAEATLGACL